MQRERKKGVDFLRSRGNQAGGTFPAAAVQICCICFAESGGEGGWKADVLNLQMAEVNLRSVSEVCGGGWFGGGMTIGFRERAM